MSDAADNAVFIGQTYFIRSSAGSTPNLLFDLPALALVHGLRGKIFEETLDEMINAK